MEPGAKCICQYDDWYNAFGDKSTALFCGMRLTVKARKNFYGALFVSFEETPEDNFFQIEGFKPMRNLN
jgi:hypothetical protein